MANKNKPLPGSYEHFEATCSIAAFLRVKAVFRKSAPLGRPIEIEGKPVVIDGRPVLSTGGFNLSMLKGGY